MKDYHKKIERYKRRQQKLQDKIERYNTTTTPSPTTPTTTSTSGDDDGGLRVGAGGVVGIVVGCIAVVIGIIFFLKK